MSGIREFGFVRSETEARATREEIDMNASSDTGTSVSISRPCITLGYCPYGVLVEGFPLSKPGDEQGCARFGHQCPAFVVAEQGNDSKGRRIGL